MNTHQIRELFRQRFGVVPESVQPLAASGSARQYFRLVAENVSAVGVINEDVRENQAFLSFTGSFRQAGFPVPQLLAAAPGDRCYLLSDLGDLTLFGYLRQQRDEDPSLPGMALRYYRESLEWLLRFQTEGPALLDFSRCYPREAFDRQSMMWDLNYFKYYFLKPCGVTFGEQDLENDFLSLAGFLLEASSGFFMYRDFQSRNIMIHGERPWFIDYQGGRRGPLQYDVASLLYDAKADLPQAIRDDLAGFYLSLLEPKLPGISEQFMHHYPGFILIRILQALGAYGFRGYFEQKTHFLDSVPYALKNLEYLRLKWAENPLLPALTVLWQALGEAAVKVPAAPVKSSAPGLTVTVVSFSYKNGIPPGDPEHGGGFVFDCRALPNPGRYVEYRDFTGRDPQVIGFLERERAVEVFLHHVYALVGASVKTYIQRGFTSISVAFGCTGGRHRSVYAAENLAAYLTRSFPVRVMLRHTNLEENPS